MLSVCKGNSCLFLFSDVSDTSSLCMVNMSVPPPHTSAISLNSFNFLYVTFLCPPGFFCFIINAKNLTCIYHFLPSLTPSMFVGHKKMRCFLCIIWGNEYEWKSSCCWISDNADMNMSFSRAIHFPLSFSVKSRSELRPHHQLMQTGWSGCTAVRSTEKCGQQENCVFWKALGLDSYLVNSSHVT